MACEPSWERSLKRGEIESEGVWSREREDKYSTRNGEKRHDTRNDMDHKGIQTETNWKEAEGCISLRAGMIINSFERGSVVSVESDFFFHNPLPRESKDPQIYHNPLPNSLTDSHYLNHVDVIFFNRGEHVMTDFNHNQTISEHRFHDR